MVILGAKKSEPKKGVEKRSEKVMRKFSPGECAALKRVPLDHSQETQKPRSGSQQSARGQTSETSRSQRNNFRLETQKPRTLA